MLPERVPLRPQTKVVWVFNYVELETQRDKPRANTGKKRSLNKEGDRIEKLGDVFSSVSL